MNPGDWFTLQFVGLQKLSTPIVNSRIAGLPKVNISQVLVEVKSVLLPR